MIVKWGNSTEEALDVLVPSNPFNKLIKRNTDLSRMGHLSGAEWWVACGAGQFT